MWTNAITCHNTWSRNKPTNTLLAEKDGRLAMVRLRFPGFLVVFGESPAAPFPTPPMLLPYRANVLLCLLFLLVGSSRSAVSPTHARDRRQRSASLQPTTIWWVYLPTTFRRNLPTTIWWVYLILFCFSSHSPCWLSSLFRCNACTRTNVQMLHWLSYSWLSIPYIWLCNQDFEFKLRTRTSLLVHKNFQGSCIWCLAAWPNQESRFGWENCRNV